MLKIAHRGNTNGPSWYENQIWYIQKAIDEGFQVEVDLWGIRGKLWLGHDSAQYLVTEEWLEARSEHLWVHCKNLEALDSMTKNPHPLRYFWHQTDDYTLTSNGYIWTYPGKPTTDKSILVSLGSTPPAGNIYAVCSDYVVDLAGIEPASNENSIVLLQA